jgi:DNA-binding transcriptional LysR family regulator
MSTNGDNYSYTPAAAMPDRLIRYATFRQLQIFESIFRLGSFTRAAEELFLTQPTVSMQLKKLSDAAGMPLFEHVGRHVEPTEAGRELYHACRQVFDILSNVEMKLADLQGLKRGRLRIGVITTAKYLAPEMLGEFSKLYPGIDLALKVTNRDRIIERMYANEDDLYIMGQAPDGELEVTSYEFAPNPLVVMASRNHPLLKKKKISIERISEEPFIIREPGSGIRDAILRKFSENGLAPNIRMELGSNEAIKHAIVGDLGISVLSLHTLTLEGANGPVAILDVDGFPIMRNWYIVHPKNKELSLAAQAFLDYTIQCEPDIRESMQTAWPLLKKYLVRPKVKAKQN